jgi:hypothetical protein
MGSCCRALNDGLGVIPNGALACVGFTKGEVCSLTGGTVHGVHAAGCVNDDGEVVLGVLRPNGAVLCSAVGMLDCDTGCLAVSGCGGLAGGLCQLVGNGQAPSSTN